MSELWRSLQALVSLAGRIYGPFLIFDCPLLLLAFVTISPSPGIALLQSILYLPCLMGVFMISWWVTDMLVTGSQGKERLLISSTDARVMEFWGNVCGLAFFSYIVALGIAFESGLGAFIIVCAVETLFRLCILIAIFEPFVIETWPVLERAFAQKLRDARDKLAAWKQEQTEQREQRKREEQARRAEEEQALERGRARNEIQKFYDMNAELLREHFPRELLECALKTAFADDVAPADAWSAVQQLIAQLQPVVREERRKREADDQVRERKDHRVRKLQERRATLDTRICQLKESTTLINTEEREQEMDAIRCRIEEIDVQIEMLDSLSPDQGDHS